MFPDYHKMAQCSCSLLFGVKQLILQAPALSGNLFFVSAADLMGRLNKAGMSKHLQRENKNLASWDWQPSQSTPDISVSWLNKDKETIPR